MSRSMGGLAAALLVLPMGVVAGAGAAVSAAPAPASVQRVELEHLRSETRQVFREPSGLHTMEQFAYPVRARKGSEWVPVDTSLKLHPDGSVRPGAIVVDLRLSGGGDGDLVALGKAGKQVRMGWQGRLPRPVLDGDTATYPEVLPGVDLKVRVEAAGFQQLVVVKDRTAAKNPALRKVRFPVSGAGLTVATKPDGTTVATDRAGRALFTAGKAAMWDTAAPARTAGGEPIARSVAIPTSRSGSDLVIEPDQAMLGSATTRYPVTIDPSWSVNNYLWTHVMAESQDTSYWDFDRETGAKVGRAWGQAVTYRSLVQFQAGPFLGSKVVSSRFDMTLNYSPTSSPTPAQLWRTRTIDRSQPVTWRNMAAHWYQHLATASGNAWDNQPDMVMGWADSRLTTYIQSVADNHTPTVTFGIKAETESAAAQNQWKKFHGGSAKLVVTYNNAPYAPERVNFSRPRPCGTAAAPTMVSWPLSGYSFSAKATDKDDDNLVTRLSIHRASDQGLEYELDSANTTSGAAFAWPAIPREELTPGQTYYYVAKSNDNVADDGIDFGPATPRCYFTIDAQKPRTAMLESTDFPDGEANLPTRTVGTIRLKPAIGDTDVTEYLYGFRPERITSRIKAGPDGTVQLPVTVWQTATGGVPSRTLHVRAVDAAGNESDTPAMWQLSASKVTQLPPKRRGDVNGDGRADLSMVLDQGEGRTGIWNVVSKPGGGLHVGQLAWDSGINGGYAMYRTRPVRGDFDGDGRTDVVLIREEAGRRIGLYRGSSDGERYDVASAASWHSGANGWPLSTARIVAGDVNGDGADDVVAQLNVAGTSWRTLTFLGPALSNPVEWLSVPSPWAGSAPLVADVDGDDRADLVDMQNLGSCRTVTRYFKSSGTGFSATPVTLLDSTGYCWERSKPQVADVDGDGKDDIVALYENSPTDTALKVFRSTGTALTLAEWWRDTSSFDPARTAVGTGDVTGDGKDDVGLFRSLDGGGREVFTLASTGTSFGTAVSGWKEPRVGASTGPSFDIEERTYELVNRNSSRCLGVYLASQVDAEKLVQNGCNGALNQRFRLKEIAGTDQYEMHTVHYQGKIGDGRPRCLDVDDRLLADETMVLQWPCVGTSNQQLRIEYLEGSSYDTVVRLRFAHSGKCASPSLGSTAENATIVQRTCTSEASQQWILRAAFNPAQPVGKYRVRAVHGGHALDVVECKPDGDVRTWVWVAGSPCQRWEFRPLGDDVYKIIEPSTGEVLDVLGCTGALNQRVGAVPEAETACQRWRVEPAVGGSWSVTQEWNGNSLDVAGCSPNADARLITWRYWNGPCQRYLLDQP